MPYSQQHKEESRRKILRSALLLFSERGFDSVTIDQVMEHAGLTRGAFYNHFDSKGELYNYAMINGAKNSGAALGFEQGKGDVKAFRRLISSYLNQQHLKMEQSPCPLAFLVSDVTSRDRKVRETYTKVYRGLLAAIQRLLPADTADSKRYKARAIITLMVGGVALGRALDDDKERDRLLDSCQRVAFDQAQC